MKFDFDIKIRKLIILLLLLFIKDCLAQSISLDKLIKFDNIAYIEYDRIRQSLFKQEQYRNHIKWWYKTTKSDSGITSVSKFILKIDTLKTYLYRNGILTVFAHNSKQQYSEIIDSVEVCKKYHPYFSLPHLSFGSIYRTYIDSNNTNLSYTNIENFFRFQINGNFSDKNVDTSFYKEIIINADIVDSCLKFSGIKILTNKNDSAVTKLYYTKCPIKISNNAIDSIIENLFIKYKNYSELKPTNEASNKVKNPKINFKDTVNLINNSKLPIKDTTVKLILYDFWYISCIPCINSIPFINHLQNKYGNYGLKIIGVNYYDTSKIYLNEFIKKHEVEYMIALKYENDFFKNIAIDVFPTILLIDAEGNFIYKHEGYSKSSEYIIENKITEIIKH